jgi:hypothetical protein
MNNSITFAVHKVLQEGEYAFRQVLKRRYTVPIHLALGFSHWGVKRPERNADHSPPSTTVVREQYAFMGPTVRDSSIENRTQTHGKHNDLTISSHNTYTTDMRRLTTTIRSEKKWLGDFVVVRTS